MDFVENPADGIRIAFRTAGSGPALVMVHGTTLSQVIWRGFGYSREFADEFTVITPDLRGHGRSDKPHDRNAYSMDSMVSDVLAVLDATGTDRAHFLGYSLGGRVGFSLAATHPERMLSFISAAGAPSAGRGSFDRVFFPGCIEVLETGGMAGFLTAWEHSGATIDDNTRAALTRNDALALAAYMRQSQDDPGVPDAAVAGIDLPTLLLVGSKDEERLDAAKNAAGMMPSATLRLLPGATHGETLQHPDALPAVREFLARVPSAR
ncbi:alpha/beta hydrolase [Parafrigoribacterium mesophilum]|uniref:alpha/beta fold hydrolase n=1 Tax=Parafrigoribacterium mesophilum TaxID=433646 RepID=UPI0031FC7ADD